MKIDADEESLEGSFELVVTEEDEPLELEGRLRGKVDGDTVLFEVSPFEGADKEARYRGEIRSAGSYASQAMFGTVDAVDQLNFGGGTWIAWRFAQEGR